MGALEEPQGNVGQSQRVGVARKPRRQSEQTPGVVGAVAVLAPGTTQSDVLEYPMGVRQPGEVAQTGRWRSGPDHATSRRDTISEIKDR